MQMPKIQISAMQVELMMTQIMNFFREF